MSTKKTSTKKSVAKKSTSTCKPSTAKRQTSTAKKPVAPIKKAATNKKQTTTVRKTSPNKSVNADQVTGLVSVEIRRHRDSRGGHPHVMVDKVQGKEVSVGLTHSPKSGKNMPNRKLEVNPLGGKETVYMQRRGTVAPKKEYGAAKQGNMHPKDYTAAQKYGETAKQKALNKKKK